jgi:hypothetical protein
MCAEYRLAPTTVGQVFPSVAEYRITRFNRFLSEQSALMGRAKSVGSISCIELSWRLFSCRKPPAAFN